MGDHADAHAGIPVGQRLAQGGQGRLDHGSKQCMGPLRHACHIDLHHGGGLARTGDRGRPTGLGGAYFIAGQRGRGPDMEHVSGGDPAPGPGPDQAVERHTVVSGQAPHSR